MRANSLLQYRKDPRFIVTVPVLILTITTLVYYLMQRAKELSPEALSSRLLLFVLWNVNLILILGILFVLLRGVIKLLLERQRGILGSRFRSRLVVTYLLTSLLPILLLFLVATDLLRVSIDRWFNSPVRTVLRNGEKIAESEQNRAINSAAAAAREVAATLDREDALSMEQTLAHVRRFHPVDLVGVYQDGSVLKVLADPRTPVHELSELSPTFFSELATRGSAQKIDVASQGKWLRYVVALPAGKSAERQYAVAGVFLPDSVSRMIDENVVAQKNFEQLDSQRPALKASQTSLFLTVTLSILFGTLWTSIYVSRRITGPVQALAQATTTLAEGNYGHRIDVKGTDEFAVLIDSFNRMSSQLQMQRKALTESNLELQTVNQRLDEERAYLSTVLDSVSTGIIAFTDDLELLSINRAALRILQIPEPPAASRLDELLSRDFPVLSSYVADLRSREPRSREVSIARSGELRYLEISAARLEGTEAGGWVLALEDSTQLVQAQKLAAWSEAARRIAHEIKNPLTPIQLSAERIAKKFRQGDADLGRVVEEGTTTIVREVGQLKQMVDEFSRFARMPAVHLRQTRVATILDEVARLYRDVKPGVKVSVRAEEDLELVIDPEQIRRALINLLDNAMEATDEGEILLSCRKAGRRVLLEVTDTGRGVPDADKQKLFLPYFSTKKEGTGLGLAIVHRIVNDHDGRISVHDNRPRGTRFEIELPA